MAMTSIRLPALTALLAAAAGLSLETGCSHSQATPTPSPCATVSSSLSVLQSDVFGPTCGVTSCHDGQDGSGTGLELYSASQTLATGVNITATEQFNNSPVKIVLPGQHEQSYLWLKVTDAAGISGQRMPFNGDPLDSCLADAIAGWIDAGAQND